MPQVSFSTDIKPLFSAIDISHMKRFGVELDSYAYMSNPDNANKVLATLSPHDGEPPSMPPGGPYWTADQLALFAQWQSGGYQPWPFFAIESSTHLSGPEAKLECWAPIPIRVIVGYGFMAHGYSKLVSGPVHFAQILRSLGVSTPGLMGWITIVVELVGGLAVLILGGTGPLSLGYLTAKFKSKRAISIGDKVWLEKHSGRDRFHSARTKHNGDQN
jgi:DoxX-like protein